MKILVVQDYLRSGGTERQSVLLSRAFGAAGHTTTLLTFRPGGKLALASVGQAVGLAPDQRSGLQPAPSADLSAEASAKAEAFRRLSLQHFDFHLDWFAPALFRTAAKIQPEIILCMGRMANGYAGWLQSRLPGAAVVATMRTGKPLPWPFRRSLRRVRHIVANSQQASDVLISQFRLPPGKITVIHNALVFPPGSASIRNEALRVRNGAAPGATVLLCVAMFRPEKGQRELVEIVAGLPSELDWQLWLAGDGAERAACIALARSLGLGARVRFPGYFPDPSPLYSAADIAVHASGAESLSNFIIEAQAHGLAAVAYDTRGIRECLLPERTGWVIARGDRTAFRAALANLIREGPAARAARGAEASAFARTAFEPARQVRAYLELFAPAFARPRLDTF